MTSHTRTNPLTHTERSRISRRTWRNRQPKGIDPYTRTPVWVGGVRKDGHWYHRTSVEAMKLGIPAGVMSNPLTSVFGPRREKRFPKREGQGTAIFRLYMVVDTMAEAAWLMDRLERKGTETRISSEGAKLLVWVRGGSR